MWHIGILLYLFIKCLIFWCVVLLENLVMWLLSITCLLFGHFQQYFSYIMAVNFIGGGNRSTLRKPPTCHKSLTNFITWCCIEYTSPWAGFELTTLVMIGTDCIGDCISNYQTITATTASKKTITGRMPDNFPLKSIGDFKENENVRR